MKITVRLPGGGWIKYEKKPMSDDAKFTRTAALLMVAWFLFLFGLIWLLH